MTKMIPPVPTSAVMMPTPKQKIGFSIESIVGDQSADANNILTNAVGEHNSTQQAQQINNNNSPNGPSSPPQTPPAVGFGSTHLPSNPHQPPHLSMPPHSHMLPQQQLQQQLQHHHQLTAAQQHVLHQHLIMQHHHHQQQHQQHQLQQHQQQQQQQQQQLQLSSPKSSDTACSPPPLPLRNDIQDILQRLHNSAAAAHISNGLVTGPYSPNAQTHLSPVGGGSISKRESSGTLKRERSPMPAGVESAQNPAQRHQPPHTPPKSVSPQSSHPSSPPSALSLSGSPATPQQQYPKTSGPGPMLMPGVLPPAGLVRPFPLGPGGPPPPPTQPGMPDIKALPPYINAPPELPPQHNPHLIAAAQFQMAAALQAGHVLGPAAAAAAAAGLPPHAAAQFMPNPGMPRDSYPLYPWLLSRHGRIFPHRFPGNFLLQPFRKPKRIRTAFSPSQLLKLEHAFESNQYVVGAERKALAQSLNLSETQVKVWFQNRRTKHKRMQQEDEKGGGSSERNSHSNASCDEDEYDDDDELIDMEMDDCPSDDEGHNLKHELDASH